MTENTGSKILNIELICNLVLGILVLLFPQEIYRHLRDNLNSK